MPRLKKKSTSYWGEEDFKGRPEFLDLDDNLRSETPDAEVDSWREREALLLAKRKGMSPDHTAQYVRAMQVKRKIGGDTKFFYALFRQGLPTDLPNLYREGREELRNRIKAAVDANIIDDIADTDINAQLDKIEDAYIENELVDRPEDPSGATLRVMLDVAGLPAAKQRSFLRAYLKNDKPMEEFWAGVTNNTTLKQQDSDAVQFAMQAAAVSMSHPPMMRKLKERGDIKDAIDLAKFEDADWENLIGDIDAPDSVEGENKTVRRKNYAKLMRGVVTKAYPTAALAARWRKQDDLQTADFKRFFDKNPQYEFRATKVRQFLKNNPGALDGIQDKPAIQQDLEGMRRLFQIIPDDDKFEQMGVLWRKNIRSAYDIARIGEAAFVRRFKDSLGGETSARLVFANARKKTAMGMMLYLKHNPFLSVDMPLLLGPIKGKLPDDLPDWETLFGSVDFCACSHCRSVYSPAAYLTDLLQFLEEANAGGGQSALDNLLKIHRPDLAHILLNCENTNTVMPYIDLANEILENAVVNGLKLSIAKVPQTTTTAAELRANPEHIIGAAYDKLSQATFPWSLPFNLWNEERMVYLDQLGISVHEIMDVFHREGDDPAPIDRAAAWFGMTRKERDIVTGRVGHGLTMPNPIPILELLKKTQLSYSELTELLGSKFIFPSSKDIDFANQSCSLAEAKLALTDTEKLRLYQFRKFQKFTTWTVSEQDEIILSLNKTAALSEDLMVQASYLDRLKKRFRLSIPELLSWWSPINLREYEEKQSFYHKLFLSKAVNNPLATVEGILDLNIAVPELKKLGQHFFNSDGTLNEEITPFVLAGINLNAEDLEMLIIKVLPDDSVTFKNLSYLYRIASFTRALRIPVKEYIQIKQLIGKEPVTSPGKTSRPQDTWDFVELWNKLKIHGFSIEDLSYLLLHQYDAFYASPSGDKEVLTVLSDLQKNLIELTLPEKQELSVLTSLLTEKLPIIILTTEPAKIEDLIQIVLGESKLTIAGQKELVSNLFPEIFDSTAIIQQFVTNGGSIKDPIERVRFILNLLLNFLAENRAVQVLAEALGLDLRVGDALLKKHVKYSENGTKKPALSAFLETGFVQAVLLESGKQPADSTIKCNGRGRLRVFL